MRFIFGGMGKVDTFEEFLKRQKASMGQVDIDKRREAWVNEVEALIDQLRSWLSEYKQKGLLSMNKAGKVQVTEQSLGIYKADFLNVKIGDSNVLVIPRPALSPGFLGRLEMRSDKGQVTLELVRHGEWRFVRRAHSGPEYYKLTKDSFIEELQSLA